VIGLMVAEDKLRTAVVTLTAGGKLLVVTGPQLRTTEDSLFLWSSAALAAEVPCQQTDLVISFGKLVFLNTYSQLAAWCGQDGGNRGRSPHG
jgi:hypothetical protein